MARLHAARTSRQCNGGKIEAARFLAQQALLTGGATDEAKIDFLTQRILARPFRPAEKQIAQASLDWADWSAAIGAARLAAPRRRTPT